MVEFLTKIAVGEVAVCAVFAWVFVARHARVRWWELPEGRYMMRSKVGIALLFTMTLVFRVVHPKPETGLIISVLLFGWIAYSLGELLFIQHVARRDAKRGHEA